MKKITDFLKTDTKKEDLKSALRVLKEFKSFEGEKEWLNIPFMAWIKLEQFREFLEYLVNGKELREDTVAYMNDTAQCTTGEVDDDLKKQNKKYKSLQDSLNRNNFNEKLKDAKLKDIMSDLLKK